MRNYFIGSFCAVFILGSLLIFNTIDLVPSEVFILIGIMCVSSVIMIICEFYLYQIQVAPIREYFSMDIPSIELVNRAYSTAQVYPIKAVYRSFSAHFLGISVPGISLTALCIYMNLLKIPYSFLLLALLGALLITSMHALIEYFLSLNAVKPIINHITVTSNRLNSHTNTLKTGVFLRMRTKILISFIFLTIFPVMLSGIILLAKSYEANFSFLKDFIWTAVFFVIILLLIALGGALLLTSNLQEPIEELKTGMLAVKNGKLETIENPYTDEFSHLFSGFNHMVDAIKEHDQKNEDLLNNIFRMLAATLDARDPYTAGHSIRVAEYAGLIGAQAGLAPAQLDQLRKSALVHDIGKIGIKDAILLKTGKLTDHEFNQIKQHPAIGAGIFEQYNMTNELLSLVPGIKYHHERFDGKGYPEGLSGEDIPLFGRIIAVADAYDAMTSDRTYRNSMSPQEAISILRDGKGTQWDPEFAQLFIDLQEKELERHNQNSQIAW